MTKTQKKGLTVLSFLVLLIATIVATLLLGGYSAHAANSSISKTWNAPLENRQSTLGIWGAWVSGGRHVDSVQFSFDANYISFEIKGSSYEGDIKQWDEGEIVVYVTSNSKKVEHRFGARTSGRISYDQMALWNKDLTIDFWIWWKHAGTQWCEVRNTQTYNARINATSAPTGSFTNAVSLGSNKYVAGTNTPSFTWTNAGTNQPYRYATLNGKAYTKGAAIDLADGTTNTLILRDEAGNYTTYTLIIDKTPPTLAYPTAPTRGNFTVTATAGQAGHSRLYYRKGSSGDYSYTTSQSYSVTANTTNEGVWYFYAVDRNGNASAVVSVTLDVTRPTNPALAEYTNNNLTYSPTDSLSGMARLYYRKGASGSYSSTTSTSYTVSATTANNGIWYFYAEDRAGNTSATVTSTICVLSTYGNQENIYNSYKVTSWWRVSLPARIFNVSGKDISGTYSFETYAAALSFATTKETEYRVSPLAGGWVYVSATNESIAQTYTDRDVLDLAIKKYATSYISAEQRYSSTSSNNYNTPVTTGGKIDTAALTKNTLTVPSFLSSYKSYNAYLIRHDFSFKRFRPSFATNLPSYVQLTYLANDVQTVSSVTVNINFDAKIQTALTAANQFKQGYYLVNENDAAGNSEKYIVYLDTAKPELRADVTYGNGTSDSIMFNEDYIDARDGTLYYTSFSLNTLQDNIDTFLCVLITGPKNYNKIFLSNEKLPSIDAELAPGKYTINVYDRTLNILKFEILIAGAVPSITHSSLSNVTKVTLAVTMNGDTNNTVVDLRLYKIMHDGTFEALEEDDDGTRIDFTNLTYIIRTGGKYTMWIIDLYGREVWTDPIFYLKDLPVASLSGVGSGGRTNRDVTLKYAGGNTLIVYVFINNVQTVYTDYDAIFANNKNTWTVIFPATEATSYEYFIFLHKEDDINLFLELTFEIDCIMGEITIANTSGQAIALDGATKEPFLLNWSDALTVRYYNAKQGEYQSQTYTRNKEIVADGLYYFIVRDDVGNEMRFSVMLKSVVNYKLEGNFRQDGNVYLTNEKVKLTVLDMYTAFTVNGEEFINGAVILEQGVYVVYIVDNYGNEANFSIDIYFATPTFTIQGVASGEKTMNAVTVSFVDKGYLTTKNGAVIREVKSGEEFCEDGDYYITIEDIYGNTSKLNFSIDTVLPAVSIVMDGGTVRLTDPSKGNLTYQLLKDGKETAFNGKSVSGPGDYVLIVTDDLGNIVRYEFSIDYRLNGASVLLIVLGCILFLFVLYLVLRSRKGIKVK